MSRLTPSMMMTREYLAIFDVDGTLIDSAGVIVRTMEKAFDASGVPTPAAADIRALIGLSLPRMIRHLAGDLPERTMSAILADYRLGFANALDAQGEGIPLYPGVEAGLARLSEAGITLGIATGKSRRGVNRLLDKQGWHNLFATQQCADDHPSKPHPAMVQRAMAETLIDADRTVMVGDATYDVEMARAAGVTPLGVDWGYHSGAALAEAGAVAVMSDFDQTVAWILEAAQ